MYYPYEFQRRVSRTVAHFSVLFSTLKSPCDIIIVLKMFFRFMSARCQPPAGDGPCFSYSTVLVQYLL
jgi:hypothetical protein